MWPGLPAAGLSNLHLAATAGLAKVGQQRDRKSNPQDHRNLIWATCGWTGHRKIRQCRSGLKSGAQWKLLYPVPQD